MIAFVLTLRDECLPQEHVFVFRGAVLVRSIHRIHGIRTTLARYSWDWHGCLTRNVIVTLVSYGRGAVWCLRTCLGTWRGRMARGTCANAVGYRVATEHSVWVL